MPGTGQVGGAEGIRGGTVIREETSVTEVLGQGIIDWQRYTTSKRQGTICTQAHTGDSLLTPRGPAEEVPRGDKDPGDTKR